MMFLIGLGALGAPLFHDRLVPESSLTAGSPSKDWILEVNGGGLVVSDFDADGALDLVLIDGSTPERVAEGELGLPPRLLLGDGALGLTPPETGWAIAPGRWCTGGAAGDLNGDGRVDLVVTNWGADQVHLNIATGFESVVDSGLVGERWGTSAALFDYDLDGVLDLYVVNYLDFDFDTIASRESGECVWKGAAVNCGPEGLTAEGDQLYRGLGTGRFADVSSVLGLDQATPCFGLGAVTGDFDVDGDQDVYVTNDSMPNHYWRNDAPVASAEGTLERAFTEVGMRLGVAVNGNGREEAGMGVAQGDLDADGKSDFVVTNFSGESHSVYLSGGRRSYRERSGPTGIGGKSVPFLGWGTGLADFDNDGDLDLFACHGHVYPQADAKGSDTSYAQEDLLWINTGAKDKLTFEAKSLSDGPARVSRAALSVDLDRDGDVDVLNIELDGGVHLLENQSAAGAAHWLGVRVVDQVGGRHRSVVGTRVEAVLIAPVAGTQVLTREVTLSAGFQASGPGELHFGLGTTPALEGLRVRWPDGETEFFKVAKVDQWLTLQRGQGEEK